MRTFEEMMSVGNMNFKGLAIEASSDSLLVTAKSRIYVPEKKIVLMDQMTEKESRFVISATNKGGLLV